MATVDPLRRYDGFSDLSGGMDSGRSPESIGETNMALGVNVSARNSGWPRTRPGWSRRLPALDNTVWQECAKGFFQGAAPYYNPDTGKKALIVMSSGRFFEIDLMAFDIRELTPDARNNSSLPCYFCQAESFLIVQNGLNFPLIYDGDEVRRVEEDSDEVPVGTVMAYGQGRLFVASPERREIVAGDLIYGGSVFQVDIDTAVRDVSGSITRTLVTTKTAHGFANGDKVSIRHHLTGDANLNATWEISNVTEFTFTVPYTSSATGPTGGGVVEKFQSGRAEDLLRFTETNFLNEKGVFRLPVGMGLVTGMVFFPVQNIQTGQGDLLVFGERGAITLSVSGPRDKWLDSVVQRVALSQIGATSPNSVVTVNSDVFFRSGDGLRSYRNTASESDQNWGQTPISVELSRIMTYDSPTLLGNVSAGLFDNRLLFTMSPREMPLREGNPLDPVPKVYRALGVLDFTSVSRLGEKGPAAYDGIWTGLDTLQLVSGRFGSQERSFLFAFSVDRTLELWEITRDQFGVDTADATTKLAFTADCGMNNDNTRAVERLIKSESPTDVILAGDLNYPDGAADVWDSTLGQFYRAYMYPFHGNTDDCPLRLGEVASRSNRLWTVPGNHEWVNTDHLASYFAYTNTNARYYKRTFGDIEIFFLDSEAYLQDTAGGTFDDTMKAWLAAQIAASTALFKGVVFHRAPYSSGSTHGGYTNMRWAELDDVDFVVTGHEHNYERVNGPSGTTYFVVGTGGATLYPFTTPVAGSQSRIQEFGALFAEIVEGKLVFTFKDTDGFIRDTVTLTSTGGSAAAGRFVRLERAISCALESRALVFDSAFAQKKLVRGDLWLADLWGNTRFNVFWRPDVHPHWFYWGQFSKSIQTDASVSGTGVWAPIGENGAGGGLVNQFSFDGTGDYVPVVGQLIGIDNASYTVTAVSLNSPRSAPYTYYAIVTVSSNPPSFSGQLVWAITSYQPNALLPAVAPQIRMPTPPQVDDSAVTNRVAHLGFSFQVRIEWEGEAQIQKCVLHALEIPEATQGNCPGVDTLRTVFGQGSGVPTPRPTDLLAYSSE